MASSSHILSSSYDSVYKELTIYFFGGGKYVYSKVPYDIYDALIQAKSLGKYFDAHIKNKFTAQKIY